MVWILFHPSTGTAIVEIWGAGGSTECVVVFWIIRNCRRFGPKKIQWFKGLYPWMYSSKLW